MEYSLIQLNDLPDEILLFILKKLHNIEVLYSLIDVNKRLDTIVRDSIFTSHLTLICFSDDTPYPLPDPMINRFCVEILPKIHHKIRWLDVESSSMERILLSTSYSNLNGLGLYDLGLKMARDLFTENLSLYIVNHSDLIIDGDKLEKIIISHMTRLNKFAFSIRSILDRGKQINFPSNEYIQYTFRNFKNNQVISCIDLFPETNALHCHIYSYPYTLTYYNDITNNFPGGLFKCAREISLYDERPFGHEFFLQIAQSFPFMKTLTLFNRKPQMNDNQQWSIIEYHNLTDIDIVRVHDDYVEQFLLDTKMCLPNNVFLFVDYKSLDRVTHNFTRDRTRNNCLKIDRLLLFNKPKFCRCLKDYFPYAEIL